MKKLLSIFLILCALSTQAQDYTNISAFVTHGYENGGIKNSAGVTYGRMSDDFDAYTGFYGTLYLYEGGNAGFLIGWRLESKSKLRFYTGYGMGLNFVKDNWLNYEVYGGVAYDYFVSPYFEVGYGAFIYKAGITIKL